MTEELFGVDDDEGGAALEVLVGAAELVLEEEDLGGATADAELEAGLEVVEGTTGAAELGGALETLELAAVLLLAVEEDGTAMLVLGLTLDEATGAFEELLTTVDVA